MEYRKEPVKGFEEYQIDTNGVIYNKNGSVKKTCPNGRGYEIVNFYVNHKRTGFGVHTLVAKQFLPEPPLEQNEVNHIDGNKSNNCVSNLEWVSAKENMRHSNHVLGNMMEGNNWKAVAIYSIDVKGNRVDYPSIMTAAREISTQTGALPKSIQNRIWAVLSGRRETYNKCHWYYA